MYLVGGFVVKKNTYEKISPEHQNVLRESFKQHMDDLKLVIRKENQEALKVMAKHGLKILKPSDNQISEFKALSNKAMKRLGKNSFSQKVHQEVIEHLNTFRGEQNQ
jgi:TRAP-type C4-dicarboxylate transport system substrate-binding protein